MIILLYGLPPADDASIERSRGTVQGGRLHYRREGQARVRCEGQGEIREKERTQVASRATDKDGEEVRAA